jgi:hypothetical protein
MRETAVVREDAATKAIRLLISGRLNIVHRIGDDIAAQVRGDSAEVYNVSHVRGAWACDCPALGRCSHLIALQRVAILRSGWLPMELALPRHSDTPLNDLERRRADVTEPSGRGRPRREVPA